MEGGMEGRRGGGRPSENWMSKLERMEWEAGMELKENGKESEGIEKCCQELDAPTASRLRTQ